MWIYYSGRGSRHNDEVRDGWNTGLFRAILRRDGFVSVDASLSGGEFVTPPLAFDGEVLELNVDCGGGGWLLVELQDEEGRPVEGYTLKTCETIVANAVKAGVSWQGVGRRIPTDRGPLRLRVAMRSAKLYSFRFVEKEEDQNGLTWDIELGMFFIIMDRNCAGEGCHDR